MLVQESKRTLGEQTEPKLSFSEPIGISCNPLTSQEPVRQATNGSGKCNHTRRVKMNQEDRFGTWTFVASGEGISVGEYWYAIAH